MLPPIFGENGASNIISIFEIKYNNKFNTGLISNPLFFTSIRCFFLFNIVLKNKKGKIKTKKCFAYNILNPFFINKFFIVFKLYLLLCDENSSIWLHNH